MTEQHNTLDAGGRLNDPYERSNQPEPEQQNLPGFQATPSEHTYTSADSSQGDVPPPPNFGNTTGNSNADQGEVPPPPNFNNTTGNSNADSFSQWFNSLSSAILTICTNKSLLRCLGTALIVFSSFAEKQTKNERIPGEQERAIIQVGTLGYTAFRMDVDKGSWLDKVTPNEVKGYLAEFCKEAMDVMTKGTKKSGGFRVYDKDVNMTSGEKDRSEDAVRYDFFQKNPYENYKLRKDIGYDSEDVSLKKALKETQSTDGVDAEKQKALEELKSNKR